MKISRIYFLIPLCVLFAMSCEKGMQANQEDIIEEDLMLNILMDFHLAEAIAGKKGGPASHREILRKDLQEEVLDRYGLDRETFYRSYQYYLQHPVVLDSIYVNIIRILEEKSKDEKDKYIPSEKKDTTSSFMKKRLPQTEE